MGETNMCIREKHTIGIRTRERIVTPKLCPPLSVHHILLAGITEADDHFEFAREAPGVFQLLACVGGVGEVLVDDAWVKLSAGNAYLTPAGAAHAYRAVAGGAWRLVWIMYSQFQPDDAYEGVKRVTIVSNDFRPLESTVSLLHEEMMSEADPGIMFSLTSLAHSYARRYIAPPTRLAPVWDAVRVDLARKWTVADMAAIAGASSEHLRRLCAHETGMSPLRYITQLRMREASALLCSSSYNLAQAATRVGYDNVFAFSTAFKRVYGVPPSEFRLHPG